jgi:hypothetical protein
MLLGLEAIGVVCGASNVYRVPDKLHDWRVQRRRTRYSSNLHISDTHTYIHIQHRSVDFNMPESTTTTRTNLNLFIFVGIFSSDQCATVGVLLLQHQRLLIVVVVVVTLSFLTSHLRRCFASYRVGRQLARNFFNNCYAPRNTYTYSIIIYTCLTRKTKIRRMCR